MNPGPGRREPLAGSKLLASARHRTYCCAHRLLTHCSMYLALTLALTPALTSTPAPMPPTASCSGLAHSRGAYSRSQKHQCVKSSVKGIVLRGEQFVTD